MNLSCILVAGKIWTYTEPSLCLFLGQPRYYCLILFLCFSLRCSMFSSAELISSASFSRTFPIMYSKFEKQKNTYFRVINSRWSQQPVSAFTCTVTSAGIVAIKLPLSLLPQPPLRMRTRDVVKRTFPVTGNTKSDPSLIPPPHHVAHVGRERFLT
jgi:hypothetical protein